VIVAVIAMPIVQVACDDIVNVVGVRNRLVAAFLVMLMRSLMRVACMPRSAGRRIRGRLRYLMLINVAFMHVMEMPIVQII